MTAWPFAGPLAHEAHLQDVQLESLRELVRTKVAAWVAEEICVEAVKAQNSVTATIPQRLIDSLDKQWRTEIVRMERPLINRVLSKALSARLAVLKDSMKGAVVEIVVMDGRGLNVAASDIHTDYWQGDEEKWQETYLVGSGATHVGHSELENSTDHFQAEVSMTITDPQSGRVIGVIAVAVDLDRLAALRDQAKTSPYEAGQREASASLAAEAGCIGNKSYIGPRRSLCAVRHHPNLPKFAALNLDLRRTAVRSGKFPIALGRPRGRSGVYARRELSLPGELQ